MQTQRVGLFSLFLKRPLFRVNKTRILVSLVTNYLRKHCHGDVEVLDQLFYVLLSM